MVISTHDLISGDLEDPSTQFEGVQDLLQPFPDPHPTCHTFPSTHLQATDPAIILGDPSNNDDVLMNDQPAALISSDLTIHQQGNTCTCYQSSNISSPSTLLLYCPPEERHTNMIFATAAFSQLKCSPAPAAVHVFDNRFECLHDLVKTNP
ncbi:hypothetical protein PGT21_012148 [Puccinia graminis f. sp. tritici]|uniref:Uncharacterized protein n=1 Tax=Puccinia graminis f. sp. tritici TaxID=56615 RepID=A0A5B0MXG2_PUCGR|nr:hypothetical protein PGT21_012148 [Puccinia graminis f. sp. tritici]